MKDTNFNLTEDQLELLDLYSMNALDGKELEEAQDLILSNTHAKQYVDSNYDVFAQLQDNEISSDVLLKRITNEINKLEKTEIKINSRFNPLISFISGAAAASVIAVILSYALWSGEKIEKNNQNFSLATQVSAFAKEPGVTNLKFHDTDGKQGPIMMMNPAGDVMVDARNISKIDNGHIYQLWVVLETDSGLQVISAGILGNKPGIYMTHISGKPVKFVITKEKGNGVEKSTEKPFYASDEIKNI